MAQKENVTVADALKLVGGGIVGAGLALLLAPQSGKETRHNIVRYSRTMGRKADRVVNEFADTISDFAETVGEKAADIISSGGEGMTVEAKKGLLAAIEKGQEKLEKQKSKLAKMIG